MPLVSGDGYPVGQPHGRNTHNRNSGGASPPQTGRQLRDVLILFGALCGPPLTDTVIAQEATNTASSRTDAEMNTEWSVLARHFHSAAKARADLAAAKAAREPEASLNPRIRSVAAAEIQLGQHQVRLENRLLYGGNSVASGLREIQEAEDAAVSRLRQAAEIQSVDSAEQTRLEALRREAAYLHSLSQLVATDNQAPANQSPPAAVDRAAATPKFEEALTAFRSAGTRVMEAKTIRRYDILHDKRTYGSYPVDALRDKQELAGRELTAYVLALKPPAKEAAHYALQQECLELEGERRGLATLDYSGIELATIEASERSGEARIQLEYLRPLSTGQRPFPLLPK